MASRRFLESDDAMRTVADLRDVLVVHGSRIGPDAPISGVIELLLAQPESRVAHVVDADGKLVGTVSWRSVLNASGARMGVREDGLFSLLRLFRDIQHERVGDLMRPPTTVTLDETLREVLLRMQRHHENDLPVVDAEGRLLGEVNGMRVMRLALATFRSTEEAMRSGEGGEG